MKLIRTLTICLALALAPTTAWAHSGGTDSDGCHTDSRTDTRHCHSGPVGGDGSGGLSKRDAVIGVTFLVAYVGLIAAALTWGERRVPMDAELPEPEAPEDDELVWGLDGWGDEDSGGVILQVQW